MAGNRLDSMLQRKDSTDVGDKQTAPSAGGGGGDTHPVDDTTSLVQDPADNTKQARLDVGAVATATTRVVTIPDQNIDLTPGTGAFATAAEGDLAATALQNVSEDTTPELGGELDAGAHTIGFTAQSATGDGTTTIDWKLGNKFNFTFGAFNETFTFTAPTNPCNLILKLIQDATGGRTATWPATIKWPAGTAPTLSTAASAVDLIAFYYDGTNFYAVENLDFS